MCLSLFGASVFDPGCTNLNYNSHESDLSVDSYSDFLPKFSFLEPEMPLLEPMTEKELPNLAKRFWQSLKVQALGRTPEW